MVMPKVYAAEFRRRAVALARSGKPVGQMAVDLRVSEATLFRWVAQDQVDRGERAGLPTVERVELAQARKRIRELEVELEITKMASALFEEGKVRPKGSSR
jgi:transposase-like protein